MAAQCIFKSTGWRPTAKHGNGIGDTGGGLGGLEGSWRRVWGDGGGYWGMGGTVWGIVYKVSKQNSERKARTVIGPGC